MTLQPKCEDVETAEGVAITVTGVAQVGVLLVRLKAILHRSRVFIYTQIYYTVHFLTLIHISAIDLISKCYE